MRAALFAGLFAALLAALSPPAQAAGFLPLAEAVQPLHDRLAVIAEALPSLQARLRVQPQADDTRETTRERALAWARLRALRSEQRQLTAELAEAQRAAQDPLRLH